VNSSYPIDIWQGAMCRVQYCVPLFQRFFLSIPKRKAFRGPYITLHHYTTVPSHRYRYCPSSVTV
jgi:hypothetical protein